MYALVNSNQDGDSKIFKAQIYYLTKYVIKNYNVIINRKNFYYQPIDSDIKRYQEIRKLITGQSEYTTGCLLDYEYIKNHYRLIALDLSRQQALPQIEVVVQLKKWWWCKCWWRTIYFCFTDFRKNQINEIKIFSRKHNSFIIEETLWRSQS